MNTPKIYLLTIFELIVGAWVASVGYEFLGGLMLGLTIGAFLSRANTEARLRLQLAEIVEDEIIKERTR